jgi:3-isopropylmalate/(R)-2-methylmalate dehydratase small subunit
VEPFITFTGIAAPIDEPNIDTNQLCPTRFNKIPRGPGHARILFHDLRFTADGKEKDFVLNREPYRRSGIIVSDRNFGCGSARETAVYALYEFGIRTVIAPSFSDIFLSNSYKNGLLPIVLSNEECADIRKQLHKNIGTTLTVNLPEQTVTDVNGKQHQFDIPSVRKRCLLEGLDDIARTQQYSARLDAFEAQYRKERPWLFAPTTSQ